MSSLPVLTFATLLKRYRRAAGLTQEELDERSGVSADTISALERGVNISPRKDTIDLLANALALTPAQRAQLHATARGFPLPDGSSEALLRAFAAPALPVLVGRKPELALLKQHLAGEGPPALWLSGEPGIGKTRLLHEVRQQAAQAGWMVLSNGCHRRGGQEPYAPLLGALEQQLQQQSTAERRLALEGCTWLVRLLPELAESGLVPVPRWNLPPEQEQRLMFAAVRRFLVNVAGPVGTLLVLDDLQWAGADALDLLVSLARAPSAAPLRIVGAYRSTEAPPQHPLADALDDLAHDELAVQAQLGPLAPGEAAELVAPLLQGAPEPASALIERLLPRAGGVPYFLVSCAQALRTGLASDSLPFEVAQSIRQRVAALPSRAQELLGLAAVAGRRVERPILLSALSQPGWEEGELLAALEAACQARLLEEEAEAYHFPHDLVREVVAADLSAARRASLHGRVAQTLEQQPGELPIERLAFHYTQAGRYEQAVVYLERAQERAWKLHANAQAAEYLQKLVDLLKQLGRPLEAAEKSRRLGMLLTFLLKGHEEATEVLEQAAAAYSAAGKLDEQLLVQVEINRGYVFQGMPYKAVENLRSLLEGRSEHEASPGLAEMYSMLTRLYRYLDQPEEARMAAERALALARSVGDKGTLARALHEQAANHQTAGEDDEALRVYAEEIPLAQEVDDRDTLSRANGNMACLYMDRGQFAEGLACTEGGVELAEQGHALFAVAGALNERAELAFLSGDWKGARRDLERALALSREVVVAPWQTRGVWLDLSRMCLAECQWELGEHYLAVCLGNPERFIFHSDLLDGQVLLAAYHLHQGRFQEARACLEPLLDQSSSEGRDRELTHLLAWALLELGEETKAEALLEPALARTRARKKYAVLADGLLIWVRLLLRQRRWPEAQATLDEVLALVRPMPYPYSEAKALYLYGLLNKEQGEAVPARERLEAALVILRKLGERLYAGLAEQTLAMLEQGRL